MFGLDQRVASLFAGRPARWQFLRGPQAIEYPVVRRPSPDQTPTSDPEATTEPDGC